MRLPLTLPLIEELACNPEMIVEAVEGIRGPREHNWDPGQRPGSPGIEGLWRRLRMGSQCGGREQGQTKA